MASDASSQEQSVSFTSTNNAIEESREDQEEEKKVLEDYTPKTAKLPQAKKPATFNIKGTKLKDIREVGEAIEDSPPKADEELGDAEALTEEQILGLI